MKAIARVSQRVGVDVGGLSKCVLLLVGLGVLAMLATYWIEPLTTGSPETAPALFAAAVVSAAYLSCALAERFLIACQEPAFTLSEKARKRLFYPVLVFSVVSFCLAIDLPLLQEISTTAGQVALASMNGAESADPYPMISAAIVIATQVTVLAICFVKLRRSSISRSSFLLTMLAFSALIYFAEPILAELVIGSLATALMIIFLPFILWCVVIAVWCQ